MHARQDQVRTDVAHAADAPGHALHHKNEHQQEKNEKNDAGPLARLMFMPVSYNI